MARVTNVAGGKVREAAKRITQGPIQYDKELEFYSKCDGKVFTGFEQEISVVFFSINKSPVYNEHIYFFLSRSPM